jgi:hypothetical protein
MVRLPKRAATVQTKKKKVVVIIILAKIIHLKIQGFLTTLTIDYLRGGELPLSVRIPLQHADEFFMI